MQEEVTQKTVTFCIRAKREDGIGCGCGEIKAFKSEPHE